MPIDIEQLRSLVKFSTAIGPDKGSQAMAAAAQAAKPSGGIPLPKPVEDKDDPAAEAVSAEQQQMEQEKLEQQRRKELDAKENEIRGLKHELELERVEREKATNNHELDMRIRQEQDKLKSERDKLEKDRLQLIQEKARQDNMHKAEEMKHQADLDKATYKHEAEIAKQEAKATADLAKQQAQSYIATTDKSRAAADKYYSDAKARIANETKPSISPALQNQLDGAIASLNRFRKVHQKQVAIPKPGTPPLQKFAMVKWSYTEEEIAENARINEIRRQRYDKEQAQRMLREQGIRYNSESTDVARAAAHLNNHGFGAVANTAMAAARGLHNAEVANGNKRAIANWNSYMDTRSRWNGFNSHKDLITSESQFDRDRNATANAKKEKEYSDRSWWRKAPAFAADMLGDIYGNVHNAVSDAAANSRNAGYYGANRFWNTTFKDNSLASDYYRSLQQNNYGDSVMGDIGNVGLQAGLSAAQIAALVYTGGMGNAALGMTTKVAPKLTAAALRYMPKTALGRAATKFTAGAVADTPLSLLSSSFTTPLEAGPQFQQYGEAIKSASVLPVPGAPPEMIKKSYNGLAGPTSNSYYDANNIGNTAYYNNPYNSGAGWWFKTLGGVVSGLTGGLVNPYKTVSSHEMVVRPKSIIPGHRLLANVVQDTKTTGNSNVHDVVNRTATEKHRPGQVTNYNGLENGHISDGYYNNYGLA